MAKQSKKKEAELSDEQVVEMIAEEVFLNALDGQNKNTDPFEVYSCHAQAKIFGDAAFFKKRCLKGFHLLTSHQEGTLPESGT